MTMRWMVALAACGAALAAGPPAAAADRKGSHELLMGLGSVSGQTATIYGPFDLEADEGISWGFRYRYNFTDFVAIEADMTWMEDESTYVESGFDVDTVDSETSWFLVNVVFHMTTTKVAPYLSAGAGFFEYEANLLTVSDGYGNLFVVDIEEDGPILDLAVGVDARTEGRLVWGFEARMLDYDFEDFQEDWSRLEFRGQLGWRF